MGDVEDKKVGATGFPLARIKKIMKADPDVKQVNTEAVNAMNKATELFVEYLIKEGYEKAAQSKRKTIMYNDLSNVVKEKDILEFLNDIIPVKKQITVASKSTDDKKTKDDADEESD